MATFVLVHGAMHGGWCWRRVRLLLTARGHDVLAPSLCGQGERQGELTPEVGLSTHVDDVTRLLWYEDLRDVHLVLHSYAGVLAGPVAERARGRIASITFLGAFVTEPGECLLDVEPPEVARRYRQQVQDAGEGWYLPADSGFMEQWGITPDLRHWVGERLAPFPFRCQTDPAAYDPAPLEALPKTYVRHTRPPLASLDRSLARAETGGWTLREIPCGHDLMLAAPEATARVIEETAVVRE